MSGEKEIIATAVSGVCSEAEWRALCNLAEPKSLPAQARLGGGDGTRGH